MHLLKKTSSASPNQPATSRRLLRASQTNLLPLFGLVMVVIQSGMLIQLIILSVWVARLAQKPSPTLVQLVDGKAISVTPKASTERTPATIQTFVSNTLTLYYNWSGVLPNQGESSPLEAKRDTGVEIDGRYKVTTPTWTASFAFAEDFRVDHLKQTAQLTPQRIFSESGSSSRIQVMLQILHLGEPIEIKPGRYKLPMVANLIHFEDGRAVEAIKFNKRIYVRAVYPQQHPLPESASELVQAAYRIRETGLEIYRITDLSGGNQ